MKIGFGLEIHMIESKEGFYDYKPATGMLTVGICGNSEMFWIFPSRDKKLKVN